MQVQYEGVFLASVIISRNIKRIGKLKIPVEPVCLIKTMGRLVGACVSADRATVKAATKVLLLLELKQAIAELDSSEI